MVFRVMYLEANQPPSGSLKGNCAVNDLHRGLCVLYLAELPYPGSCSG